MAEVTNGTAPDANKDPNKKKPKGKRKRMLFLLVILVAALAAAAYYFLVYAADAEEEVVHEPPVQAVDMGTLVVNLADGVGARYLRLSIVVEIPEEKELQLEFKELEHRIRDGFLVTLRQKTAAEVRGPDSVDLLRTELLEEVNRHLTKGQAKEVFFKEYMVQ